MHEVHIYDAIVLAKRPRREADVAVDLLTPSGLIRATARSARAEKSKLRYGLEPLTRGRVALVRGKHEWRLTGVVDADRGYLAAPAPALFAMARIARLLMRLVPGVEPSPELFSTASDGFDALAKTEDIESVEIVLVLRILSCLGYLPHSEALSPFVEGAFTIDLSAEALKRKALLVRTINESLRATGL